MKTIRFKNDWRYSRKGDVIEEGDGVAVLLIQRGIAEEVTEPAGAEEVTPEADTSEEEDVEENLAETSTAETAEGNTEQAEQAETQDGGENALPQIITRQVPGPTDGGQSNQGSRSRRGGRG